MSERKHAEKKLPSCATRTRSSQYNAKRDQQKDTSGRVVKKQRVDEEHFGPATAKSPEQDDVLFLNCARQASASSDAQYDEPTGPCFQCKIYSSAETCSTHMQLVCT